jgi:fibronectin type 3 domain-containing protein
LEFTDTKPVAMLPNYYIIYSVDDKGNENPSMVQIGVHSDNVPPAKPKNLVGEIGVIEINGEKRGIVTLTWEMNNEQDLLGYRIFTANAKNREFYEVSHAPNSTPFYLDTITLNTLSEKIYYKIFANDFNMNVSEYSEILTLDVPDIIAPVAPVLRDYVVNEKNIVLTWENSHSKDVLSQKIWRKENSKKWQLITEIKDNTTKQYADSTAVVGITYEYALETTDDAGLSSGKSSSLLITKYDNGKRLTVSNLKGEFDKETKGFRLTWDYNFTEKGDFKYVIYRAAKIGEWTAYGAATEKSFNDNQFYYQEEGYSYAVKVIYADGGESELSQSLVVKF